MRGVPARAYPYLLLALFGVAAFLPTLQAGFNNWDDPRTVFENPAVKALTPANLRALWWGSQAMATGMYVPLTQTSHAVDGALFGLRAGGHHAMSLALHVAAALVLFAFLKRFLNDERAAFVAAAVFLLHPAQVESVAWISERNTVLSGLLIFLALLVYDRRTAPGPRRFSLSAEWPVLLLTAAALLAKPIAVVIPPLLAALDLTRAREDSTWPCRRGGAVLRAVISKGPYFVLAAGAALATLEGHRRAGFLPDADGDPLRRLSTSFTVVLPYLRIVLLPTSLTALHVVPDPAAPSEPAVWAGLLTVLLGGLAAIVLSRRSRVAAFFTVWAVSTILPVTNIVPIDVYLAERYLYLPLVALAATVSLTLPDKVRGTRGTTRFLAVAAVTILTCLAMLSHARCRVWRDSDSLWTDTLAKAPRAAKAQGNYGILLLERGDLGQAITHLEAAVRLGGTADMWRNLGIALSRADRPTQALAAFDRAARLRPGMPDIDYWRGNALMALRRLPEAETAYRAEIRRQPGFAAAWLDLGKDLADQGRLDDALVATERAVAIDPRSADSLFNVGVLRWAVRRDASGARDALKRSLELGLREANAARARTLLAQIPPTSDGPRP